MLENMKETGIPLKESLDKAKASLSSDCVECGACVEVCPYRSSGLLKSVDSVELSEKRLSALRYHRFSDEAYAYARGCLLCGVCENACPAELNPYLLNIISRVGYSKWGEEVSERYEKDTANLKPLLPGEPFNIFRILHSLQIRPEEVKWVSQIPQKPKPVDVLLFLSCIMYSRADRIFATLNLLDKLEIHYAAMGGVDFCCGFLNVLAGDVQGAEPEINRIAAAMAAFQAKTLVVDCTSCYGWFKTVGSLNPLPFTFQHITQYVGDRLDILVFHNPVKRIVTYHDPCHFGRAEEEWKSPRRILKAIPGVRLVEMERNRENTACCGSPASGYRPEWAEKARAERLEEAKDTNADILLTTCEGCVSFFRGAEEKPPFSIDTLMHFLGEALGFRHENRLEKLYALKNASEILRHAKGCLWEDRYSEPEMIDTITKIFKVPPS
jgi:Fe-S oxidoreductase